MNDELAKRLAWFLAYASNCAAGKVTPRKDGIRFPCPCCGYLTLPERGVYEICILCNWEDDGQDDPLANEVWGGPNGEYSLAEARRNFGLFLIMYDTAKGSTRLGGPDSSAEIEAKRTMINAFNAMPSASDAGQLDELWKRVSRAESMLTAETHRKIREYEARQKGKGNTSV